MASGVKFNRTLGRSEKVFNLQYLYIIVKVPITLLVALSIWSDDKIMLIEHRSCQVVCSKSATMFSHVIIRFGANQLKVAILACFAEAENSEIGLSRWKETLGMVYHLIMY